MYFEHLKQITDIAKHTSCAIFVIPNHTKLPLKFALTLSPNLDQKSSSITVEQMREFLALTNNRETKDRFFVISPADTMNEAAQNAFLKTLEEPNDYCHFVLTTEQPALLLPTILSRSQIFILRTTSTINAAPKASDKTMALAKKLISANPADLVDIAAEISKNKTKPREQALEIISLVIELLYKSYFKTNNPKFLTKLPQFIQLHENLSNNGHIKLHLIADLL